MKKKLNVTEIRTLTAAASAVMVLLAGQQAVFAQEVVLSGEKCPLTVISDLTAYAEAGEATAETESGAEAASGAEAPSATVELDSLNILGILNDQYAAVTYEGGRGFVPLEEIAERIPAVNLDALEHVENWTDIGRGSSGEQAREVQENLIALSYLTGEADGVYGGMTAEALAQFQTASGLEATGTADVFTWFMLHEAAGGSPEAIETAYPPVFKPEEKFAEIIDSVQDASVLEQYLDPVYKFSFDVFSGTGEITDGTELGSFTDESRPIDRINMLVKRIAYVYRNEAGEIEVVPAISVTSEGAYRPYVTSVIVRSGVKTAELPLLSAVGGIEGTNVTEEAVVPLTEEAEALLSEPEGVVLRIAGSSKNYDVTLS